MLVFFRGYSSEDAWFDSATAREFYQCLGRGKSLRREERILRSTENDYLCDLSKISVCATEIQKFNLISQQFGSSQQKYSQSGSHKTFFGISPKRTNNVNPATYFIKMSNGYSQTRQQNLFSSYSQYFSVSCFHTQLFFKQTARN